MYKQGHLEKFSILYKHQHMTLNTSVVFKLIYMIYIIYIQRFTSVHLKQKFDLIYINLYNLYLVINSLYVLYGAAIRHAGISTIEKQFYYYFKILNLIS